MILLYIDEDAMEDALVKGLATRHIDAVTVMQARTRARKDAVQLEYAASQGRTLFSYNVGDYRRLHREFIEAGKHHAGIVVAQQQRFGIGEVLRRLVKLATTLEPEQMMDRFEFLSDWC